MKINYYIKLITIILVLPNLFGACNVAKDQAEESNEQDMQIISDIGKEHLAVGYAEFKKMNVEERWNALSPARRNYFRENPDRSTYFLPMVKAYPDMEEIPNAEPPRYDSEESKESKKIVVPPKTPEEWWNEFSEARKKYMRENPELFPEFKHLLEN
ncbi:MAG: hypothetical protein ACPG5B_08710 [Chitinophagales bacterium]